MQCYQQFWQQFNCGIMNNQISIFHYTGCVLQKLPVKWFVSSVFLINNWGINTFKMHSIWLKNIHTSQNSRKMCERWQPNFWILPNPHRDKQSNYLLRPETQGKHLPWDRCQGNSLTAKTGLCQRCHKQLWVLCVTGVYVEEAHGNGGRTKQMHQSLCEISPLILPIILPQGWNLSPVSRHRGQLAGTQKDMWNHTVSILNQKNPVCQIIYNWKMLALKKIIKYRRDL